MHIRQLCQLAHLPQLRTERGKVLDLMPCIRRLVRPVERLESIVNRKSADSRDVMIEILVLRGKDVRKEVHRTRLLSLISIFKKR